MKRPSGFTLIELMVVVAIIAILTSLAITAYSISIGKAQLAEVFTVSNDLKIDTLDYYHQTGNCPVIGTPGNGLASNSTSYAGNYVASAAIASQSGGCVITVNMRNSSVAIPLRGKQVVFTMAASGEGTMQWTCHSNAAAQYLPQTCR